MVAALQKVFQACLRQQNKPNLYSFILCVSTYVCGSLYPTVFMERSENSLQGATCSLYLVCPGVELRFSGLVASAYQLSHLFS